MARTAPLTCCNYGVLAVRFAAMGWRPSAARSLLAAPKAPAAGLRGSNCRRLGWEDEVIVRATIAGALLHGAAQRCAAAHDAKRCPVCASWCLAVCGRVASPLASFQGLLLLHRLSSSSPGGQAQLGPSAVFTAPSAASLKPWQPPQVGRHLAASFGGAVCKWRQRRRPAPAASAATCRRRQLPLPTRRAARHRAWCERSPGL